MAEEKKRTTASEWLRGATVGSASITGGPWDYTTTTVFPGEAVARPKVTEKGEEASIGVRLLKEELKRRQGGMKNDGDQERKLLRQLSDVRKTLKEQRAAVEELEKEIALLEEYARMREAGEVE